MGRNKQVYCGMIIFLISWEKFDFSLWEVMNVFLFIVNVCLSYILMMVFWFSSVLQHPQAISWHWPCGQANHRSRKKAAKWDWDRFVTLHKEQHTIMESLIDYGYSGMDNGTKVCHFLQGIKSTDLEAAVNVVQAKAWIWCNYVLSGPNGHEERTFYAICPYCED